MDYFNLIAGVVGLSLTIGVIIWRNTKSREGRKGDVNPDNPSHRLGD